MGRFYTVRSNRAKLADLFFLSNAFDTSLLRIRAIWPGFFSPCCAVCTNKQYTQHNHARKGDIIGLCCACDSPMHLRRGGGQGLLPETWIWRGSYCDYCTFARLSLNDCPTHWLTVMWREITHVFFHINPRVEQVKNGNWLPLLKKGLLLVMLEGI